MTLPTSNPSPAALEAAPHPAPASRRQPEAARPLRRPAFFDQVPSIVMRDPLAEILGAAEGGLMEYTYADAVKMAGHSCPTVAGAWLMTRTALERLYPHETPRRGELRVELREAQDEGVAGVIASVAGWLTGAAGDGGFKGLGGRHGRRGLLEFGRPMRGQIRITRLDTGQSIEGSHNAQAVARPPALGALAQSALAPEADAPAREAFGSAWQGWVRAMLIDHADDPSLIAVED